MAANDPITGKLSIWAGKTFGATTRKISDEMASSLLDNAEGSNAITLMPGGVGPYEEVPLNSVRKMLPPGPHVLGGENLYVAIDPDTNGKAFDSTGQAGTVVKFKYALRDLATGKVEIKSVTSEAVRNTTVLQGGLTDDFTVQAGRPNALYAFQIAPPGTVATVLGHIQVDARTSA